MSGVLRSGAIAGRKIRFWFDSGEPLTADFHSIASLYLWGYRDISSELPTIARERIVELVPAGSTLIHLTSYPSKIESRIALLRSRGIVADPACVFEIGARGSRKFFLGLQTVHEVPR